MTANYIGQVQELSALHDPHLHKWPTIQRYSISNNGPGEKFPGKAHLPYSTLEYGTVHGVLTDV